MEEIEGERPLAWAKAENTRSLADPAGRRALCRVGGQALAILNAKDRVPGVSFAGDGSLRNFWQDADHVRGLWRKTTLDSYRTAEPRGRRSSTSTPCPRPRTPTGCSRAPIACRPRRPAAC
jgi:prolyl oligopeptidase